MSRNILENTTQLNEFLFSNPLPYKNWKLNQKIFHRYCLPFFKKLPTFSPENRKNLAILYQNVPQSPNLLGTWYRYLNFFKVKYVKDLT